MTTKQENVRDLMDAEILAIWPGLPLVHRFLLATGLPLQDVIRMDWSDIDEETRIWYRSKAAAHESGKLCVPVHNYLYEDSVIRTRELLDSGKLGDLVAIYVFYNIHHPEEVAQRYPGVIRQILTHHAYITSYLGGKPSKAMAMASTINDGTVEKEN